MKIYFFLYGMYFSFFTFVSLSGSHSSVLASSGTKISTMKDFFKKASIDYTLFWMEKSEDLLSLLEDTTFKLEELNDLEKLLLEIFENYSADKDKKFSGINDDKKKVIALMIISDKIPNQEEILLNDDTFFFDFLTKIDLNNDFFQSVFNIYVIMKSDERVKKEIAEEDEDEKWGEWLDGNENKDILNNILELPGGGIVELKGSSSSMGEELPVTKTEEESERTSSNSIDLLKVQAEEKAAEKKANEVLEFLIKEFAEEYAEINLEKTAEEMVKEALEKAVVQITTEKKSGSGFLPSRVIEEQVTVSEGDDEKIEQEQERSENDESIERASEIVVENRESSQSSKNCTIDEFNQPSNSHGIPNNLQNQPLPVKAFNKKLTKKEEEEQSSIFEKGDEEEKKISEQSTPVFSAVGDSLTNETIFIAEQSPLLEKKAEKSGEVSALSEVPFNEEIFKIEVNTKLTRQQKAQLLGNNIPQSDTEDSDLIYARFLSYAVVASPEANLIMTFDNLKRLNADYYDSVNKSHLKSMKSSAVQSVIAFGFGLFLGRICFKNRFVSLGLFKKKLAIGKQRVNVGILCSGIGSAICLSFALKKGYDSYISYKASKLQNFFREDCLKEKEC